MCYVNVNYLSFFLFKSCACIYVYDGISVEATLRHDVLLFSDAYVSVAGLSPSEDCPISTRPISTGALGL